MVNKELKECEVKMKKIKGLIFAIGFVLCGFVLGACGTSAEAKQDKPLKIWFENQNGKMETYQLVDEKNRCKLHCRIWRTFSERDWYSNYSKIKG